MPLEGRDEPILAFKTKLAKVIGKAKKTLVKEDLNELKKIRDKENIEISKKREKSDSFNATQKVEDYFHIDEEKKQWMIPKYKIEYEKFKKKKELLTNSIIYNFDDIVEYELLEDGNAITKGEIGRAIVGGVTGKKKNQEFTSNMTIKIVINDISNTVRYIRLIGSKTKKDSLTYKLAYCSAEDILALLFVIS